jgi:hypothetical protein
MPSLATAGSVSEGGSGTARASALVSYLRTLVWAFQNDLRNRFRRAILEVKCSRCDVQAATLGLRLHLKKRRVPGGGF